MLGDNKEEESSHVSQCSTAHSLFENFSRMFKIL